MDLFTSTKCRELVGTLAFGMDSAFDMLMSGDGHELVHGAYSFQFGSYVMNVKFVPNGYCVLEHRLKDLIKRHDEFDFHTHRLRVLESLSCEAYASNVVWAVLSRHVKELVGTGHIYVNGRSFQVDPSYRPVQALSVEECSQSVRSLLEGAKDQLVQMVDEEALSKLGNEPFFEYVYKTDLMAQCARTLTEPTVKEHVECVVSLFLSRFIQCWRRDRSMDQLVDESALETRSYLAKSLDFFTETYDHDQGMLEHIKGTIQAEDMPLEDCLKKHACARCPVLTKEKVEAMERQIHMRRLTKVARPDESEWDEVREDLLREMDFGRDLELTGIWVIWTSRLGEGIKRN